MTNNDLPMAELKMLVSIFADKITTLKQKSGFAMKPPFHAYSFITNLVFTGMTVR